MLVEISDTIIEAIEKHRTYKKEIKYNINTILWLWIKENLPYNEYSEAHDLNIDDVVAG